MRKTILKPLVIAATLLATVFQLNLRGQEELQASFPRADLQLTQIDFSQAGLSTEKPTSGHFVRIEGGFMVSYTAKIPGTDVEFEMVPVPGGSFLMGSPAGDPRAREDEQPQIPVAIEPFWMGKHEVTWAEYHPYLGLNRPFRDFARKGLRKFIKGAADAVSIPSSLYEPAWVYDAGDKDDQPAAMMTPFAAMQYTKYLSLLSDDFYRLPTEAEWEYACRAGTKTTFYFGNDSKLLDEHAWFYDNSDDFRQKVGTKKPNPWGLYDMYGNVAEWVLDGYRSDTYERVVREFGANQMFPMRAYQAYVRPEKRFSRVARGGSFELEIEDCRSAARLKSSVEWSDEDPEVPTSVFWHTTSPSTGTGFRLIRPLVPPSKDEDKQVFWKPCPEVGEDAEDRFRNGRSGIGRVDSDLPAAIEQLEASKE